MTNKFKNSEKKPNNSNDNKTVEVEFEFVNPIKLSGTSYVIRIPYNIVKVYNLKYNDILKIKAQKLPSLTKASELNKQENKEENGMDKSNG